MKIQNFNAKALSIIALTMHNLSSFVAIDPTCNLIKIDHALFGPNLLEFRLIGKQKLKLL